MGILILIFGLDDYTPRDKWLTVGFHPDRTVRSGDIVRIDDKFGYPYDVLYTVAYGIIERSESSEGALIDKLFVRCTNGLTIKAEDCIVWSMSGERSPIRHYPIMRSRNRHNRR